MLLVFQLINLKNIDYFKFKIEKGWKAKNIPETKEYKDRLEYELKVTSIYDESLIKEEIKNIIICD